MLFNKYLLISMLLVVRDFMYQTYLSRDRFSRPNIFLSHTESIVTFQFSHAVEVFWMISLHSKD